MRLLRELVRAAAAWLAEKSVRLAVRLDPGEDR
jgi:hypothetical protein